MRISTEGVLVFASAKGLRNEYKNRAFDYNFPAGLSKLLEQQIIIALTTPDGDNLIVEFVDGNTQKVVNQEFTQVVTFVPNDTLLILSHAEFTQICDDNGDSDNYCLPIKRIEMPEGGQYLVNIKIQDTDNEFEKYEAYFKLWVSMSKIESSKIVNEVLEITSIDSTD